jgi:hypothetical protein
MMKETHVLLDLLSKCEFVLEPYEEKLAKKYANIELLAFPRVEQIPVLPYTPEEQQRVSEPASDEESSTGDDTIDGTSPKEIQSTVGACLLEICHAELHHHLMTGDELRSIY